MQCQFDAQYRYDYCRTFSCNLVDNEQCLENCFDVYNSELEMCPCGEQCLDGCPCPLFDCETGQLISSTIAETTTTTEEETTEEATTTLPSTTVETTMNTSDPPFETTRETTVPETTTKKTTTRRTTTTQWEPVMGSDIFVINSNTKNKHVQFSWAQGLEDPEFDALETFKWPRDTKVENSCSMKFRGVMYILGGSGTMKLFAIL